MRISATIAFLTIWIVCGFAVAAEKAVSATATGSADATAQPTAATTTSGDSSGSASGNAAAETPSGQPAPISVCALVNCSGHGLCIEQDGKPMCACNEGYAPDSTNGLSCLPFTTTTTLLVPARPPVVTDPEREPALKQFYSVLPNYPAERSYAKYSRLKSHGRFSGTFPDYMAGEFHGQKAGGIAMTSIGGALTVAASLFLVIGINPENFLSCGDYVESDYYSSYDEYDDCEPERIPFLVFGNIFAVASLTLYAVGIPNLAIGASRLKKVNQLRNTKAAKAPKIGNFNLSISRNEQTESWGLVGGFKF